MQIQDLEKNTHYSYNGHPVLCVEVFGQLAFMAINPDNDLGFGVGVVVPLKMASTETVRLVTSAELKEIRRIWPAKWPKILDGEIPNNGQPWPRIFEDLDSHIDIKSTPADEYDGARNMDYISDEAGQWPMREQQPLTFVQAMQENGKTLKLIHDYCKEARCTPQELIKAHQNSRWNSMIGEIQQFMDRWTLAQIMINQLSRPPFTEESIRRQEKYRSEARMAEDELAAYLADSSN